MELGRPGTATREVTRRAKCSQQKGPAVSGEPVVNINTGTNKAIFADQGDELNISIDRLILVQTTCMMFAPDGCGQYR
jgi:hypothetical protein